MADTRRTELRHTDLRHKMLTAVADGNVACEVNEKLKVIHLRQSRCWRAGGADMGGVAEPDPATPGHHDPDPYRTGDPDRGGTGTSGS